MHVVRRTRSWLQSCRVPNEFLIIFYIFIIIFFWNYNYLHIVYSEQIFKFQTEDTFNFFSISAFGLSNQWYKVEGTSEFRTDYNSRVSAENMDESGITPNTSNQQLVINGDNDSATALLQEKQTRRMDNLRDVTFIEYLTVGVLCYVNLINYMDRFTLAGKFVVLSIFSCYFAFCWFRARTFK